MVANPTKTALGVTSTTAVRPEIYHVIVGSAATPADNALSIFLQRYTAAGTATSLTPSPLDPADPASTATAGRTHTVEPTYTAGLILLHIALNQRATRDWFGLDASKNLKMPATASNGIGLYYVHSSFTGVTDSTILFNE